MSETSINYQEIADAMYNTGAVTPSVESNEVNEKQTSLFSRKTLKARDFQICEGMLVFLGKARVTRSEMMAECKSRGRKYPPYWTFKNTFVHVASTNLYDLSRLKLAKGETRLDPSLIERVTEKKSKRVPRVKIAASIVASDPLPTIALLNEAESELSKELALV